MRSIARVLPFAAAVGIFLLTPSSVSAQSLPRDRALGLAAARSDAFVNLTNVLYDMPVSATQTVRDLVASGGRVREQVEAALRGADMIAGPRFDDSGVVRVTAELDTTALPYSFRQKIRGLPRFMQADGVADVNAATQATRVKVGDVNDEVKTLAEMKIEAEGKAAVPRGADPALAKKQARRQAMVNAYTALAKKVEAIRIDTEVTIKAFLMLHPELRPKLNGALLGADLLSESVDVGGTTYQVKISLPGKRVMQPLRLGGYRTTYGTTLRPDEVEIARTNARKDAVNSLKEKAFNIRLGSGLTVGEYVKDKAAMKTAINRLCEKAPIQRVEITDEGLVKLYTSIPTRALPRDLQRLFRRGTPSGLAAIGGGLPVEPEEKK